MDISGMSSSSGLHAVSGASTGAPPQQKMSNLFDSIDTSGSSSITQSQFEPASKQPLAVSQNQGAQAIFASLDPSGTGSVSKQDFVSTMSGLMAWFRADPIAEPLCSKRRPLRIDLRYLTGRRCSPAISVAAATGELRSPARHDRLFGSVF